VPELLLDGQCGRIVEPRDQAGLALALQELAESPPLRRQLGEAARRRAAERYSMTAMLDAYEALYRRLSQRRDG
jgi:glycosyltransferase involved in cell wall biosynthesis